MLHKIDNTILAVKQRNTKYIKCTHKFCIEVPKTVTEAIALNENNGDTLWEDIITKDMKIREQHSKYLQKVGSLRLGIGKLDAI